MPRPVARELDVTPQNTQRAIAPLADAGVFEEFTGLARNRMWQSPEVLDALEDFTRSSGTSGCLIRWDTYPHVHHVHRE